MERTCQKCNQPVSQEAFLCPHCGAILDTTVPESVEKKPKKARKIPYRHIVSVILALVLVVAVVILLSTVLKHIGPKDPTAPPQTTIPPTTTQPAPLVPYEVQVKNAANRPMDGIQIHMYKGQELLFTFEADKQGKATFVLPQCDEYYVMLSNLPNPYNFIYEDTKFAFRQGQQELVVKLENRNVAYTARIVDEVGNPIEGVLVGFGDNKRLTDDQGLCTYSREYLHSGMYLRILSVPTGYYAEPGLHYFQEGSNQMEVVLKRIEDVQLDANQQFYTVSVIDEFGNPVVAQPIGITHHGFFEMMEYSAYTNGDGIATIVDEVNASFNVGILDLPDYYGALYSFEPGSNHLQIQLEIHKTEFTYTIQFINELEEPVPGVTIDLVAQNIWLANYTSDENGFITFVSDQADPQALQFHITDTPEGYPMDTVRGELYTFDRGGRSRVITLIPELVITLVDDLGQPIAGAELLLESLFDFVNPASGITDENGQCAFVLSTNFGFTVTVKSLPEGYDHLFFLSTYLDPSDTNMTIMPYGVYKTYHVYLRDEEGRPVANAQARMTFDRGYVCSITTDENGYAEIQVWEMYGIVVIDSIKFEVLPEEYEGYTFHTVTYGEDNCIYITISPERIHTEG